MVKLEVDCFYGRQCFGAYLIGGAFWKLRIHSDH